MVAWKLSIYYALKKSIDKYKFFFLSESRVRRILRRDWTSRLGQHPQATLILCHLLIIIYIINMGKICTGGGQTKTYKKKPKGKQKMTKQSYGKQKLSNR